MLACLRRFYIYSNIKVLLKHLNGDEETEAVRAKYVVGTDGRYFSAFVTEGVACLIAS